MAKLNLTDSSSSFRSSQQVAANNQKIEEAIENTLSRDGTAPNQMEANLDLNGYRVINAGLPQSSSDVVTKGWVKDFVTDISGGSGGVLSIADLTGVVSASALLTAIGVDSGADVTADSIGSISVNSLSDVSSLGATDGQTLVWDAANGVWGPATPSQRGGDLVSTNNLSDLSSASAARANLGVEPGVDVLAYDANLQSFVTTFTLPALDGTANQVLKTDGSGSLGFATVQPYSSELSDFLTTFALPASDGTANQVIVTDGSGNLSFASVSTEGSTLLKAGTILPWAGAEVGIPSNALACYGQAVSRTTYATLFTNIGTTYGAGDGSTTFNLPDLRGRVITGVDDMGGASASRVPVGTDPGEFGASPGLASTGGLPSIYMSASTRDGLGTLGGSADGNYLVGVHSSYASDSTAGGQGVAFVSSPPAMLLNWIILTEDAESVGGIGGGSGLVVGTDVLAYDANLQAFVTTFTLPTSDGTAGQFLKTDGAGTLSFASIAGGGDMLASNNLSDVVSAATARTNLGLAIGTDVQAYDANLQAFVDTFALPELDGTNGQVLLTDGFGNISFGSPSSSSLDINGLGALSSPSGSSDYLPVYDASASLNKKVLLRDFNRSDIANVKDYGALGDGLTNDTSAIQAAIDTGRKVIVFPSGTYMSDEVTITANGTRIVGENDATLKMRTNLGPGGALLGISGAVDVVVQNMTFHGNTGTVTNFNNVVLTFNAERVTFRDCNFIECRGIALLASNSEEVGVVDCRFFNCGIYNRTSGSNSDRRQAFATTSSPHCFSIKSYYENVGLDCISFATNSHYSIAAYNTCVSNDAGTIYLSNSRGLKAIGNDVSNGSNGGNGIDCVTATNAVITGNFCHGCGAAGILLANVNGAAVSGNVCTDNFAGGVSAHRGGITFSSSSADTCKDISLSGNVSKDTRTGGSVTQRFAIGVYTTGSGSYSNIRISPDNTFIGYDSSGSVDTGSLFQNTGLGLTGYPMSFNVSTGSEISLGSADSYASLEIVQVNNNFYGKFLLRPSFPVIEIIDISDGWEVTDTGTSSVLYRNSSDNTIRLKNRTGATRTYTILGHSLGNGV